MAECDMKRRYFFSAEWQRRDCPLPLPIKIVHAVSLNPLGTAFFQATAGKRIGLCDPRVLNFADAVLQSCRRHFAQQHKRHPH